MPYAAILAELNVSDQGTLLLYICGGGLSLLLAVERALAIRRHIMRSPPAEDTFATKAELAAYCQRTDKRLDALDSELSKGLTNLRITLETELRAVNRSLGRLEGQITTANNTQ